MRVAGVLARSAVRMSLLAQDRRVAVDQQTGPLLLIGDDGFADDDPFAGPQFHLQGHRDPRA